MPITGDLRSFARIIMDKSADDSLDLVETILSKMKITPHEFNTEKHMVKGKTKANFLKNTWGTGYTILTKQLGNQSVIEIYSNGAGLNGADEKLLISPFYKKLSETTSTRPEMDVSVVNISQESIEATANESRTSNNISESANSVADEIAKLVKLKAEGTISEEEFTKMKYELIDKM